MFIEVDFSFLLINSGIVENFCKLSLLFYFFCALVFDTVCCTGFRQSWRFLSKLPLCLLRLTMLGIMTIITLFSKVKLNFFSILWTSWYLLFCHRSCLFKVADIIVFSCFHSFQIRAGPAMFFFTLSNKTLLRVTSFCAFSKLCVESFFDFSRLVSFSHSAQSVFKQQLLSNAI